jgi:spermidine synthase
MISKYILPWFGSSPAVWSASLLFFQTMLTLGYAYAYGLVGKLSLRRQAKFHILVLGLSILLLLINSIVWSAPILPSVSFQPEPGSDPFWQVMGVLLISVGFPYFLLATNSTLLQAWFSKLFPEKSPYRLYSLSNFASLLGLLSYPFIFELYLKTQIQAQWWSLLYGFFVISVSIIALRVKKGGNLGERTGLEILQNEPSIEMINVKPSFLITSLWFILPAIASTLLLATTNQITQEIAVIPFLWVLPLALYLISFILCFAGDRWYGRRRFTIVLALAVATYWLLLEKGPLVAIEIQILTYCLLLFVCCLICHGELAQLRPATNYLTSYYLIVALGGATGGIFVNLVAPQFFKQYLEFALALFLCCALLLCITLFVNRVHSRWQQSWMVLIQSALLVGVAILAYHDYQAVMRGTLWMDRNFFGILRVKERTYEPDDSLAYQLVHGITIHGLQFVEVEKRNLTTTYYTETSGVGLAYQNMLTDNPLRVGVLGLGVGTIAAYGRQGDLIRFYEINPSVIDLAKGLGGYFSYLEDSEAEIEIVVGDARLSLVNEYEHTGGQGYDLIVLDTFSSDSIPIHLITFDAFDLYLNHLRNDGVIAVHISNIHLDLEPVVNEIAKAHQLNSAVVASGRTRPGSTAAVWVLLTRDERFLMQSAIKEYSSQDRDMTREIQLWTDEFSNLYQILR